MVAKRLLLKGDFVLLISKTVYFLINSINQVVFTSPGFPITTIIAMFVTYCLIQVIKERERGQALIDDPDSLPPAPPTSVAPASPTAASPTAAQPVADPSKEKAE